MSVDLLAEDTVRQGLTDIDRTTRCSSVALPDRGTLTAGRPVRRVVALSRGGGRLIVEWPGDPPAWFLPTVESAAGLLELPPNWDSYAAARINGGAVATALNILINAMENDSPPPTVVPTSGGGLQFEWHMNSIDLEVEVASTRRCEVYFADLRSHEEWEGEVSCDLNRLRGLLARLTTRE